MADIVDTLFGPTPWQINQAQNVGLNQSADRYAAQDPFARATGSMYRAGGMLARPVAGALGMVDPQMQESQMREQVMGMGGDLNTSQGLKAKAAQFAQAGDQRTALKLLMAARNMEAQEAEMSLKQAQATAALNKANTEASPFAKINPKDYTPESMARYMQSRNPADLVAVDNEKDPTSYREWVLAGKPGTYDDWLLRNKKASGTSVTTVLPEQEKSFEKELGSGQAKELIEGRKAADDAVQMLQTNKVGRSILEKGMVTGFGANAIVGIGQALKQAGINFGGDATANAQAYTAVMAQNVGKLIKQFGAGTGLSDADREYATKMAGGLITVDEAAIRKVLDINDRAARNVIALHNKRAGKVKTNVPLTVDIPDEAGADLAAAAKAERERRERMKNGKP